MSSAQKCRVWKGTITGSTRLVDFYVLVFVLAPIWIDHVKRLASPIYVASVFLDQTHLASQIKKSSILKIHDLTAMAFVSQTVTFSPRTPVSRVLALNKAPSYGPPKAGHLSHLPTSWVPYAELVRLDKPAGTAYLYFPSLFGTLLASCVIQATPGPMQLLQTNICLLLGAVIIRGASCTWNDILDRDIDRRVSRPSFGPWPVAQSQSPVR